MALIMERIIIMTQLQQFAAPVGRLLLALIFIMAGLNKIPNYAQTAGWMDSMGVPGVLLPLVILLEVGAGLAILVGWKTRWAALALSGFCILSAIIFHSNFAVQAEMISFMKNLAIAGGLLFVFLHGAGSYSLDNRNSN